MPPQAWLHSSFQQPPHLHPHLILNPPRLQSSTPPHPPWDHRQLPIPQPPVPCCLHGPRGNRASLCDLQAWPTLRSFPQASSSNSPLALPILVQLGLRHLPWQALMMATAVVVRRLLIILRRPHLFGIWNTILVVTTTAAISLLVKRPLPHH